MPSASHSASLRRKSAKIARLLGNADDSCGLRGRQAEGRSPGRRRAGAASPARPDEDGRRDRGRAQLAMLLRAAILGTRANLLQPCYPICRSVAAIVPASVHAPPSGVTPPLGSERRGRKRPAPRSTTLSTSAPLPQWPSSISLGSDHSSGALDTGSVASMTPKPDRALCDLGDLQPQPVNAEMRPQPLDGPANPGLMSSG